MKFIILLFFLFVSLNAETKKPKIIRQKAPVDTVVMKYFKQMDSLSLEHKKKFDEYFKALNLSD